MATKIKLKRGTRANLNSLASSNSLEAGEPILITDEDRLAVATSDSTYEEFAKVSEVVGSGMTNPMTTAGDTIYGGSSGVPTRLPKGTDGQVYTLVSGVPSWSTPADLDEVLKLDQTTPQTLTSSPKINDLVAGQMCYVDANKQLKPIDVFWDNVNKRMGIGNVSAYGFYSLGTAFFQTTTTVNGILICNNAARIGRIDDPGNVLLPRDGIRVCFVNDGIKQNTTGRNVLFNINPRYNQVASTGENIDLLINRIETSIGSGKQLLIQGMVDSVEKFAVNNKGDVKITGSIQCGDDTAAASADKVGTTRYRETANASYVEMCVRTGASTFQWQTILTNTW